MSSSFVLTLIACILGCYFICGIPFGKIFASASGIDITQTGSKNIGMTNVARVCGLYQAALTLICDVLKAFLSLCVSCFVLTHYFLSSLALFPPGEYDWICSVLYLSSIVGHIFSPYLKGRGGKGIAVGFGAALAFSYQIAFGLLAIWLVTMLFARYVSLGSLVAAVAMPFLAILFYFPPSPFFLAPLFCISALVVWAHRANIKRLCSGTEATFKVAQKKTTK